MKSSVDRNESLQTTTENTQVQQGIEAKSRKITWELLLVHVLLEIWIKIAKFCDCAFIENLKQLKCWAWSWAIGKEGEGGCWSTRMMTGDTNFHMIRQTIHTSVPRISAMSFRKLRSPPMPVHATKLQINIAISKCGILGILNTTGKCT